MPLPRLASPRPRQFCLGLGLGLVKTASTTSLLTYILLHVFQDVKQSFDTSFPIWTDCLQNTLITWVVCGLLCLLTLIYLVFLFSARLLDNLDEQIASTIRTASRSKFNKIKLVGQVCCDVTDLLALTLSCE